MIWIILTVLAGIGVFIWIQYRLKQIGGGVGAGPDPFDCGYDHMAEPALIQEGDNIEELQKSKEQPDISKSDLDDCDH